MAPTRTITKSNLYDRAAKTAEVEQANTELAEAREDVAQRQVVLEAATTYLADVESKLSALDDSVTTLDLISAEGAVRRARMLAEGSDKRVTKLARALPYTHDLSEAVALELEVILKVPVVLLEAAPTTPPSELPYAGLVQAGKHRRDTGKGFLSGRVELYWVGTEHHRNVEPDRLERQLRALQVGAAVSGGSPRPLADGVTMQRIGIEVATAYEETPLIRPNPGAYQLRPIASGIARDTEEATLLNGRIRERVTGSVSSFTSPAESGIRRTTVELDIEFTSGTWSPNDMIAKIETEAKSRIGRVIPAVGRIESATVKGSRDRARVSVVLLSRIS